MSVKWTYNFIRALNKISSQKKKEKKKERLEISSAQSGTLTCPLLHLHNTKPGHMNTTPLSFWMLAQDLSCVGSAGVPASAWATESENILRTNKRRKKEKKKENPAADAKKKRREQIKEAEPRSGRDKWEKQSKLVKASEEQHCGEVWSKVLPTKTKNIVARVEFFFFFLWRKE